MDTDKLKELLAALAIEGPAFAGVSLGRDGTPAVVHDGDSVLCEFPGWPRHHERTRAMSELLNALPSLIARVEVLEEIARLTVDAHTTDDQMAGGLMVACAYEMAANYFTTYDQEKAREHG